MFDFKKNHRTLYGREINGLLPEAPNPKACAKDWLSMLAGRIKALGPDDFRLPFTAYKMITAAQLVFGEADINKYRILELYQRYVPDFETKYFGEIVIRNYLGSFYPGRPPVLFEKSDYQAFADDLSRIALLDNPRLSGV